MKDSPRSLAPHLIVFALATLAHPLIASEPTDDHLVPVSHTEIDANYRKLWQPRLFVTSGEVARFVLLTDGMGPEGAASVYQQSKKAGSLPGDYWVTITESSKYLGQFLRPLDEKKSAELGKVEIKRCDAPIQRSTAELLHALWLQMLGQTGPDPNERDIQVDSSGGIFSAINSAGKTLEAQAPKKLGKNTEALIKISFLLHDYCVASESERSKLAEQIENDTRALLERLKNLAAGSG